MWWHPVPGQVHVQTAADSRQCACGQNTRALAAAGGPNAAAVLTVAVIMTVSDQQKAAMLNCV